MKKFLIYISACVFAINLLAYDLDTNYWNKSDNIWTSKKPIAINELENFNYYLSKNGRDLIFYNMYVNSIYRLNPENFSLINYSIPSFEKNVYNLFALSPDEKSILYTYLENNILYLAEYDIKNDRIIQNITIDSCIATYPVQKFLSLESLSTVDSTFFKISYSIAISDAQYPYHNYTLNYNKLINFKTQKIYLNNYRTFKNGFAEILYNNISFSKSPPNNELMIVYFNHSIFDINNNRNYIFSKYDYTYSANNQLCSENYSKFNTLHIGFDGTTEKYSVLEIDSTYFPLSSTSKTTVLNRIRELDLNSFETTCYKVSKDQIQKLDYISGAVPNTKVYFKIEDFGLEFISIPSCDILGKINIDTSRLKSFDWLNENWIHYINQDGQSVMININLFELCKNNIIHASKRIATADENILFSINTIYPNLDYEWIFSDSDTNSAESFNKSFANEGLYSIKLLIKQNNIALDSVELKDYIKIINKKNRIIITDEQTNKDYLTHFNYSTSFAPDSIHWYCYSKSDDLLLWNSTDSSITKSNYWEDDLRVCLYLFVNKDTFLLDTEYANKSKSNSQVQIVYSNNTIKQENNSFLDLKYINDNLFTSTCSLNRSILQNTSIYAYDTTCSFKSIVLQAVDINSSIEFGNQSYYLPMICDSNNNFFTLKNQNYTLYDTKNLKFTDVIIPNFFPKNNILLNENNSILITYGNVLNKIILPSVYQWSINLPFEFYDSYTDQISTKKYNNKYLCFGKIAHDSLALFIVDTAGKLKFSKSFMKYKYKFYQPAEIFGNKLYIPLSQDSITTESILIFNMDDYSYKIKSINNQNKMFIKKIKHIRFNKGDYLALTGISANRNTIRIIDLNLNFVKEFYLPPIVPLNAAIEIPENLFKSTNYYFGFNKSDWSIGAFVINSSDSIDIPDDTNKVSKQNIKKQIYPNPCIDKFSLYLKLDSETTVSLNIYNHMGLLYDSIENIQCSKGENSINYNISKEMAPGIYYIEIIANNDRYFEKFIIQR